MRLSRMSAHRLGTAQPMVWSAQWVDALTAFLTARAAAARGRPSNSLGPPSANDGDGDPGGLGRAVAYVLRNGPVWFRSEATAINNNNGGITPSHAPEAARLQSSERLLVAVSAAAGRAALSNRSSLVQTELLSVWREWARVAKSRLSHRNRTAEVTVDTALEGLRCFARLRLLPGVVPQNALDVVNDVAQVAVRSADFGLDSRDAGDRRTRAHDLCIAVLKSLGKLALVDDINEWLRRRTQQPLSASLSTEEAHAVAAALYDVLAQADRRTSRSATSSAVDRTCAGSDDVSSITSDPVIVATTAAPSSTGNGEPNDVATYLQRGVVACLTSPVTHTCRLPRLDGNSPTTTVLHRLVASCDDDRHVKFDSNGPTNNALTDLLPLVERAAHVASLARVVLAYPSTSNATLPSPEATLRWATDCVSRASKAIFALHADSTQLSDHGGFAAPSTVVVGSKKAGRSSSGDPSVLALMSRVSALCHEVVRLRAVSGGNASPAPPPSRSATKANPAVWSNLRDALNQFDALRCNATAADVILRCSRSGKIHDGAHVHIHSAADAVDSVRAAAIADKMGGDRVPCRDGALRPSLVAVNALALANVGSGRSVRRGPQLSSTALLHDIAAVAGWNATALLPPQTPNGTRDVEGDAKSMTVSIRALLSHCSAPTLAASVLQPLRRIHGIATVDLTDSSDARAKAIMRLPKARAVDNVLQWLNRMCYSLEYADGHMSASDQPPPLGNLDLPRRSESFPSFCKQVMLSRCGTAPVVIADRDDRDEQCATSLWADESQLLPLCCSLFNGIVGETHRMNSSGRREGVAAERDKDKKEDEEQRVANAMSFIAGGDAVIFDSTSTTAVLREEHHRCASILHGIVELLESQGGSACFARSAARRESLLGGSTDGDDHAMDHGVASMDRSVALMLSSTVVPSGLDCILVVVDDDIDEARCGLSDETTAPARRWAMRAYAAAIKWIHLSSSLFISSLPAGGVVADQVSPSDDGHAASDGSSSVGTDLRFASLARISLVGTLLQGIVGQLSITVRQQRTSVLIAGSAVTPSANHLEKATSKASAVTGAQLARALTQVAEFLLMALDVYRVSIWMRRQQPRHHSSSYSSRVNDVAAADSDVTRDQLVDASLACVERLASVFLLVIGDVLHAADRSNGRHRDERARKSDSAVDAMMRVLLVADVVVDSLFHAAGDASATLGRHTEPALAPEPKFTQAVARVQRVFDSVFDTSPPSGSLSRAIIADSLNRCLSMTAAAATVDHAAHWDGSSPSPSSGTARVMAAMAARLIDSGRTMSAEGRDDARLRVSSLPVIDRLVALTRGS